jgi:dolichol-phosphate mannosyltransferase
MPASNDERPCKPVEILLVIPAHKPGPALLEITHRLSREGFRGIVIVDDGSGHGSVEVFEKLENMESVTVLRHTANLGKGAALKSAFRHISGLDDDRTRCIITLDADGQHSVEDVLAMARRCECGNMVIGVRSFTGDVPFRSRFGNVLTRWVLRWTSKLNLDDTQSGLRCLPLEFARQTLAISADRYEFELECILLARKLDLPIVQLPVHTIYLDDNASSHFRPVVDSLRIYMVFARFLMVSIASFVLDITLFTLFHYFSGHIVGSTYAARGLSGTFNFYYNKHAAFRSSGWNRYLRESVGYVILAVAIATVSGFAVAWLTSMTGWYAPWAKIVVDTHLFVISFLVQRFIIFRPQTRSGP